MEDTLSYLLAAVVLIGFGCFLYYKVKQAKKDSEGSGVAESDSSGENFNSSNNMNDH